MSEQLISADLNSNTFNYKFTFSVEIAPICKDDLICLPPKLRSSLGQLNPLVLCSRVSTGVHVIDVSTLNSGCTRFAQKTGNELHFLLHSRL